MMEISQPEPVTRLSLLNPEIGFASIVRQRLIGKQEIP